MSDQRETKLPPILILRKGTASAKDIALARAAGVVVLVVKDPADVRYMDPPLQATTRLEAVALQFVRDIGSGKLTCGSRSDLERRLLKVFMRDTSPNPVDVIAP